MKEDIVTTAALASILLFLAKEIYSLFRDSYKQHAKAIEHNTLAIVKLTCQIEDLKKAMDLIPEMKRDLDGIGRKVRELSS